MGLSKYLLILLSVTVKVHCTSIQMDFLTENSDTCCGKQFISCTYQLFDINRQSGVSFYGMCLVYVCYSTTKSCTFLFL